MDNNQQPEVVKPNDQVLAKEKRKKSKGHEILRFIIIGILCTIIDFAVQYCLTKFVFAKVIPSQDTWGGYLSYGLATTIAFIIANIVNFSFSRLYVFQNVDKSINTKSQKAWWTYFGLGAGGWLLGLGLQELGFWICNISFGLNLSLDITKVSLLSALQTFDKATWAFIIVFCLKTCVTMVYNYTTRKKIIFKAPKEEKKDAIPVLAPTDAVNVTSNADAPIPAAPVAVSPLKTTYNADATAKGEQAVTVQPVALSPTSDRPVTKERFQQIFEQELRDFMGPAPVKQSDDKTRAEIRKAIADFEDEKKSGK